MDIMPIEQMPKTYQDHYRRAVKKVTAMARDEMPYEDIGCEPGEWLVEAVREEADTRFGLAMFLGNGYARTERTQDRVMDWRTHVERGVMDALSDIAWGEWLTR